MNTTTQNNTITQSNATQSVQKNRALFVFSLLLSGLICWGSAGGTPRLHDVLLIWCLINCLWLNRFIFLVFSPLLLLWLLFSPIGLQYGYINAGMIASVLQTHTQEIKEFIDIKTIVYFIVLIVLTALILHHSKNIKPTKKQRRFFIGFFSILTLLFIVNIFFVKKDRVHLGYSEFLNFIPHTIEEYHYYKTGVDTLKTIAHLKDDWQISHIDQNYKNYIFIMGESASKNYLSAYGYPVNTSPFLQNVNGTKYTNAIAPAGYTIQSVPRFLSIPSQDKIAHQNNIINLAKKANMQTFWLSNQQRFGQYDNEISYIAANADEQYYLNEAMPLAKQYDNQLLPKIDQVLSTPSPKNKLIIIHLMGSHAKFSKRVDKTKIHFDFDDSYLSDYLSSLRQTDLFLQELYGLLQDKKEPFSIIYTSDHALTPLGLKHGISQFNLQVPLFKFASDDNQNTHLVNNDIILGFGFVWFLSEWLGITTDNQHQNQFINTYTAANWDKTYVFDGNTTTTYSQLAPFDGQLLLPTAKELSVQIP